VGLFINHRSHAFRKLELDSFYRCRAWRSGATGGAQSDFTSSQGLNNLCVFPNSEILLTYKIVNESQTTHIPLNGDQVAAAIASCFLTIMVVRMVTSQLVMHTWLVHRKLIRMGLVIQRAAKREIGSPTVWKYLIPNRT
jgi:hypothetical protein